MAVVPLQAQRAKLSSRAALTLKQLENGMLQQESVHAFVTLKEDVDPKALEAYGVKMNSAVGNMATVEIPSKRFGDFVASGLCSDLDVAQQMYPMLDKARADLGVDYIYNGINLPQGYDGTGVVVGVIDIGFEYGHPSYYDSTGNTLRIRRLWQQRDTTGMAPEGFSYGSEYTTPEQILAAVTDDPTNGHGSHTAGIAAGCGAPDGNGRAYRGMAPAADIVMVSSNMGDVGIFDGVRYIHQYARSVGKPCVINISLGSNSGPHDGTGYIDTLLENYLYTTPVDSIVVVVSAGNSGSRKQHLNKSFSATDTVVRTFIRGRNNDNFYADIDCWGNVGDEFSVTLSLCDLGNENPHTSVVELPTVSSTIDSTYSFQLVSPHDSVYYCFFSVNPSSSRNGRPELLFRIAKSGRSAVSDLFMITIMSTSANVHMWSDNIEFYNDRDAAFANGDYSYTIGGVGANGNAVISVGSYATRTKRIDGTSITQTLEGDLSPFSSHGPTWDGRVKPDICAPGQYLVAAINTQYLPLYEADYLFDSVFFNGQMHYYVLMQGTSMAAPSATGVVALWMQNNPSLNVNSVRTMLHSSALNDDFTGTIPTTGSNLWGWGKINAFAGLPATTVPMYKLEVATANYRRGYVTGHGRHPQGQHLIEAFSLDGYAFQQWSDGSSDNPRVVDLNSDTSFIAYFEESPCDTIRQFPWVATFAEPALNCWENFGLNEWIFTSPYMLSMGTGRVDNWLLTPQVRVVPQTSFFYTLNGLNEEPDYDSVAVVVVTGDGDTVVLADEYYTTAEDDGERHVSLTPFAGQTVRVGFHHHACTMMGFVVLKGARIDYLQGVGNVESSQMTIVTSGLRFAIADAPEEPLAVFDAMGRRVLSHPTANGTFSLPSSGVYFVRVGGLPTRKIVAIR